MEPIKVAAITGGHTFDVPNFQRLMRALPGADIYVQHMDDFASSPVETRDAYDVVLFYTMLMDGPVDDGLPGYCGKPRQTLEHLGETRQGLVILHHALLGYPHWQPWSDIVGVQDRSFSYYEGQTVTSQVGNTAHPITDGVGDWTMGDETYIMADAGAGSDILITCDHPQSNRTIAWTRVYRQSRVFCYQAGHDNVTWADPNFRLVLGRGILWAAGRI